MDGEKLCSSLIIWLQTFGIETENDTPEKLSDGITMAKVLAQIAPDFFNEAWMVKIKTSDVSNWRIKVMNLKKILKGILEYNLEVLGIQIQDFQMPNVNAVGEHSNPCELGRLLQLILGCAVNCNNKQEYIQTIMAMQESVQHVVMNAIQELMTKEIATGTEGEADTAEQLKKTLEDLNNVILAKDELMQRCIKLDSQVHSLLEEKQALISDNDKMTERLNQSENLDDPSTPAGKRYQQIQNQMEALKEEMYKQETGREEYKMKFDVLHKDYDILNRRLDHFVVNAELGVLADQARVLKDDLDVMRHKSEQVVSSKLDISKNISALNTLVDLIKQDVRKGNYMKQQIDVYKKQVHEAMTKSSEETKRADKAEFELKRAQEKRDAIQKEKERVAAERDSLKELNEEITCSQLSASPGKQMPISDGIDFISLPPEVRERFLRLQHENKMLKLKMGGTDDEPTQVLQSMLDDANSRNNELLTELRIANQRIMESEAQVEDLQENQKSAVSNTEVVEMKMKLNEQVHKTQDHVIDISKKVELIQNLELNIGERNDKIQELQSMLDKKELEAKAMEERYKKYLEKARSAISHLERMKHNDSLTADIENMRSQLQQKDKLIEKFQRDEKVREQEEKLMVTAWYNMGMQVNRQSTEERLANSSSGQSFLARQRQASIRKSGLDKHKQMNSTSDFLEY
ncbi:hypothetical protein ScPMuIL_001151 [Solemya velum]